VKTNILNYRYLLRISIIKRKHNSAEVRNYQWCGCIFPQLHMTFSELIVVKIDYEDLEIDRVE